jgi:predicted enzyme related to lactoylglutathione lyase
MASGFGPIIYPVRDLAAAKEFYTKLLGVAPYVDTPYYVGFRAGGTELGLDPHGHAQGLTGPVGYWQVDDIEASITLLTDAGAEVRQAPKDVGGGKLIASVADAEGNVTGLTQEP